MEGDVAIVGYSYRMPGGIRSDDDFWRLLSERDIVQEPVTDRYGRGAQPIGGFSGPERVASPYEGLIHDGDEWLFDNKLFGISQKEMAQLDPMARMLLTCAHETLERSGWDLHSLHNSPVGVYLGEQASSTSNWRQMDGVSEHTVANVSLSMLANRISYQFNLKGPSLALCTACSAGLTALHGAINGLRSGDCELALVGSSTYLGSHRLSSGFNALGVISADGKCHSFDADANGYMRSEGTFIFALKPLATAERDGDLIHAVITATAINAAGSVDDSVGLAPGRMITAPTRHGQIQVMRRARSRAGLKAADFDYIEAHGTGTVVGDRIEGSAIAEAFREGRSVPLRLSSVKSNVGHMEAAAFHCSLLKVVLMMQRRTFAPISKNFLVPNAEIDFSSCPMAVQTVCEPFPDDRPVTVGINSFGFGGANGHCVVQEYRPAQQRVWSIPLAPQAGTMIPVSARSPEALAQSVQQLRTTLETQPLDLYTLAGNLSRRRTHYNVRTAFAVHHRKELIEALGAFDEDEIRTAAEANQRVAFVFAGQGTQWEGCGRQLYDADPVFRRVIDAIDGYWREHAESSLREVCFSAPQAELDEVWLAQPVVFMIQCALVEMLKTWGVHADYVVGHSAGEVAAAYACGALSLAEATRLVHRRATLQQRMAGSGRMLAVALDRSGVEALLDELNIPFRPDGDRAPRVEIACENAPASMVVCGKEAELQPIMTALEQRSLKFVLLAGNIAFHSSAMDALEHDVAADMAFLNTIPFQANVPFISSVTGKVTSRLDSAYWWTNIRQPVRFRLAMGTLLHDYRPDIVLELAPHSALRSAIAQCIQDNASEAVYVPSLMRGDDTGIAFHKTLGELYKAGVQLDFAAQYPRPEPITHLLPGYPRNEQRALDKLQDEEFFFQGKQFAHGPLVGRRIISDYPLFESRISEAELPWLAEHRVHYEAIMPAAGYIELILQALEGAPCYFEEIEFLAPCAIARNSVRLLTGLHPVANTRDEYNFTVTSHPLVEKTKGELHCRGRVRLTDHPNTPSAVPQRITDLPVPKPESIRVIDSAEFYEQLEAILGETFQYGPFFRKVEDITIDLARHSFHFDVAIDDGLWSSSRNEGYVLFPVLMDGALQVPLFLLMKAPDLFAVPYKAQSVSFVQPPTSQRLRCHVVLDQSGAFADLNERGQHTASGLGKPTCSISLYDSATGGLVLHIDQYYSFLTNPRWSDIPLSKHAVAWQPKYLPRGQALLERLPEGEIEPGPLIAALEQPEVGQHYACHVVELAGQRASSQTLLASCIDRLSNAAFQTEFWLLSDDDETTNAHYEAFHQRNVALRFDSFDPTGEAPDGLLRPWSAEIILLHREAITGEHVDWHSIGRLAVPGGLVLIVHEEGDAVSPPVEDWTVVRSGERSTLLQLPNPVPNATAMAEELAEALGARWVLGEPDSLASAWVALLGDGPGVHCVPADVLENSNFSALDRWPHAMEEKAIDVFCGADPDDPTGEACVARLIAFTQALASLQREGGNPACQVTVVTRKAVLDVDNPCGQALWGLVRTMAMEVGEEFGIDFRLVDVGDADDLNTLVWIARHDLCERELAVRRQSLWVPRITSVRKRFATVGADENPPYRLQIDNPGSISGLQMRTCPLPPLGSHAVEIGVEAAALNFRDVMVTLGLLPALAYERSALGHEVGMEASGTVLRIGSQVGHCQVGDKVAFTAGGSIANRLVVHENLVFRKPDRLTMNEAAASVSVYVTAFYSLLHLARLRKGQRVLIHSAMGGVGQAAIALARHVGAEIYATAGSADKREQLLALGVRGAFDSHSFDWADDLMTATAGEGVDVILNSLAGRHIVLCLRVLRPGGWHCEIGKVDIYADNELHLSIFRKNLRFAAIDVDRLMLDDPELARELSLSCLDLLAKGAVSPVPATVFPYSQYATALRMMVNGQHQGKLVLKAPSGGGVGELTVADTRPFLDPEATYLVTGGLGGLGLSLVPYLVMAGAHHITLMDRDPQRSRTIEWLRQSSALQFMDTEVDLDIVYGDVAVEEHVQRCVAELKKPLKGVFHLAGVLDDRLLANMTPQSVAKVFAPKANGALHLHRATRDLDLDHFVLFSSTSSTFGNPGQANYSAANGFMDGLATYRRQQGLPALAYNMAAIADAGMASRNLPVLRMMRSAGTPPVSADFIMANLDYAMRTMGDRDHLITALFPRPRWGIDSSDYLRIGRLIHNLDAYTKDGGGELLMDSVMNQIAAKVAELCGHEDTDVHEPLSSFGLNSIAVSELSVFLQAQFNYRASALELMTTATATSLAHDIVHGKAEEAAEVEDSGSSSAAGEHHASRQAVARTPSVFASALADHFPPEGQDQAALPPTRSLVEPDLVTTGPC